MPELPDVTVYVECLRRRLADAVLERIRIASPFVLRSVEPPPAAAEGRRLLGVERLGKRIVLELEEQLFLVLHLMIAGRLRWREAGAKLPGRRGLAAFDFAAGSVLFTEEGTKKRASLHVLAGRDALAAHDRGGLDACACTPAAFAAALRRENHTLKRALTDPRVLDGIGNVLGRDPARRPALAAALDPSTVP